MQGGRKMLGENPARYKGRTGYPLRLVRSPESRILLIILISLMLVGPLRDALSALPLLLFLGTAALFMAPGMILSYLVSDRYFSGPARIPLAFVVSAGMFGVLAVPPLVLHWSLQTYLLVCGGVLAACAILAVILALRRRALSGNRWGTSADPLAKWLWASFLLLGTVLAFVSTLRVLGPTGDIWNYLSYVREFLYADRLGVYEPFYSNSLGTSRVKINGWLLEQAAFSRISSIDPIDLTHKYLAPALVFVALLAFYAFAKSLLRTSTAALLAGSLFALFLLVSLDPSPLTEGGMFISRITEDKFVARYIFLPVALSFMVLFLRRQKLRYLALFAFTCWTVVVIHPVGLAIIAISAVGFGLVYLMINWRKRSAWMNMTGLGLALFSVALVPLAYALAVGTSLLSVRKSAVSATPMDEAVSMGAMFLISPGTRLLEIWPGSYIMHPSLLMSPVVLSAYLLGVPFLLWRVKRSLMAQLLIGVLLFEAFLLYFPPVSTLVATYAGPGQLWRLAWPILLAALLTVSWMVWKVLTFLGFFLRKVHSVALRMDVGSIDSEAKRSLNIVVHPNRRRVARRIAPLLPLGLVIALTALAAPWVTAKIGEVRNSNGEEILETSRCGDPTFRWMQNIVSEPSVVLAQGGDNNCIAAHVAPADVVATNGQMNIVKSREKLEQALAREIKVPQRAVDAQIFFNSRAFDEKMIEVLRDYDVDYVLILAASPLAESLEGAPGLTRMDNPGKRYQVYEVSLPSLQPNSEA